MKRFKLLLLLLCVALLTKAQEIYNPDTDFKRNEISVSAGIGTSVEFIDAYADVFATLLVGNTTNNTYSGSYSIEYSHRINRLIGLGCIASYEHSSSDYSNIYLQGNSDFMGSQKNDYYTLIPTIKFNWLRRKYLTLYSKGGIGITYRHSKDIPSSSQSEGKVEKDDDFFFNFQESPIGIELGRTLCGFAEVGFGQQGCLIIGAKYKF